MGTGQNTTTHKLHVPPSLRISDLLLFVAEHDDHHLARIAALVRQLAAA